MFGSAGNEQYDRKNINLLNLDICFTIGVTFHRLHLPRGLRFLACFDFRHFLLNCILFFETLILLLFLNSKLVSSLFT